MPHPKLQFDEWDFLKSYLNPSHVMLEWGSGYSTSELGLLVQTLYSIEHNRMWFARISPLVGHNVKLILCSGPDRDDILNRPAKSWAELDDSKRSRHYAGYIHIVDHIGSKFDRVFIDGRARCECAKAVTPYLLPDHLVFVHDFHRKKYQIILEQYVIVGRIQSLAALRAKITV